MSLLLEDGFRRLEELKVVEARIRVREQVWQMHSKEDIVKVMTTLRDSFKTWA